MPFSGRFVEGEAAGEGKAVFRCGIELGLGFQTGFGEGGAQGLQLVQGGVLVKLSPTHVDLGAGPAQGAVGTVGLVFDQPDAVDGGCGNDSTGMARYGNGLRMPVAGSILTMLCPLSQPS